MKGEHVNFVHVYCTVHEHVHVQCSCVNTCTCTRYVRVFSNLHLHVLAGCELFLEIVHTCTWLDLWAS